MLAAFSVLDSVLVGYEDVGGHKQAVLVWVRYAPGLPATGVFRGQRFGRVTVGQWRQGEACEGVRMEHVLGQPQLFLCRSVFSEVVEHANARRAPRCLQVAVIETYRGFDFPDVVSLDSHRLGSVIGIGANKLCSRMETAVKNRIRLSTERVSGNLVRLSRECLACGTGRVGFT